MNDPQQIIMWLATVAAELRAQLAEVEQRTQDSMMQLADKNEQLQSELTRLRGEVPDQQVTDK